MLLKIHFCDPRLTACAAGADTGDKLTFAQLHRLPDSERDYVMGLHFNTCVHRVQVLAARLHCA